MSHPYHGARVALLTQHGKERVIGPLFAEAWGARVERVAGFDTDSLGTFTREVRRAGTQLEAARTKAHIGIELSGLPLGVASEGSFQAGPYGFGGFDLEVVILIDAVRGIEVVGRASGLGQCSHALVRSPDELEQAAREAGFPEHGLVLRPDSPDDACMYKGLRAWPELQATFRKAQAQSLTGVVSLENDLRANMNPSRMAIIGSAARDLIRRLQSACPACGMPGFGLAERLPGLPCRDCGAPTQEARAERFACVACPKQEIREVFSLGAQPAHCPECNP